MKYPLPCLAECNKGKHCFCQTVEERRGLEEMFTGGTVYVVCCRCGTRQPDGKGGGNG